MSRKNVIAGPKVEYQEYKGSLGEFYFENAGEFNSDIFQVDADTNEHETFGTIKSKSVRLAINLQKHGLTSDGCVVICSNNTTYSCVPHVAAQFLGAATAALHPKQSQSEWTHCLDVVRPSHVFVEERDVLKMEKSIETLKEKPMLVVFGESREHLTYKDLVTTSDDDREATFRPVAKNCKDTAVILFSSGTTGAPKGMRSSHYSLINRTMPGLLDALLDIRRTAIGVCFYTGGRRIIPPVEFDPERMLQIIERHKVNYMFVSPVLMRSVIPLKKIAENYDTSSLVFVVTVGSILHADEVLELRRIFPGTVVTQAYGSSETTTLGTAFALPEDGRWLSKLESVGKVTANCEIKVIDVATGEALGPRQTGEIYVKTALLFSGYCRSNSTDYLDDEGFFKTGDLGYYDEDECFYIVGRLSETFKSRDYFIRPSHLEHILRGHPDVLEAGVFCSQDGLPAACVTLKARATSTVEDIEDYYNGIVSDWERLRGGLKIVSDIPMTSTHKIQRYKLPEVYSKS
ncbi:unnamed protein product [Phyllotreta striolata]|uniref:Uncharacterized protein n=1 Tax=Phyllotreta striolata TaxID=444603 RepID=A0A9N9XR35_PHYSR|nr:unnamed protein product [Phyllotreta striolata]